MQYKLNHIFKAIGVAACGTFMVATVASCDENSWNDEHLKGFEEPETTINKTVTDTITMTNVKKLALMKANIDLAKQNNQLEALIAVAQTGVFNSTVTPEEYAPAYLDSIAKLYSSKLYYLDKNSTLKFYYPTSDQMPEEMALIPEAEKYTISEQDYQIVWGSDEDFTQSFTPSKKPEAFIPQLLPNEFDDPQENQMVVVTYNYSTQEPNFGGGSTPAPDFELSNVAATIKSDGASYTVSGIVTAICAQGFILTDNSGSILVYYGSSFSIGDYNIGNQRIVTGKGSSYGGALQLAPSSDELKGNQEYKYPTPEEANGAKFDTYLTELQTAKNASSGINAKYIKVSATDISISNNKYVNFKVAGAETAVGSIYQATANQIKMFDGKTSAVICGYVTSTSNPSYVNLTLVSVDGVAPSYSAPIMQAEAVVPSETLSAVYKYTKGSWSVLSDVTVLSAQDYSSMGLSNLNSTQASRLLPIYLGNKYPYAASGTVKYVVFNYYDGSQTIRNFCAKATFDGTNWLIETTNIAMMQFVCSKEAGTGLYKWIYDPSVYITLPAGRNASSAPFWQKCVDWVYENYDVPFFNSTDIKSGVGYVTSYGNNEYFAGTSAYQCNVDLRPSAARAQTPSVYGQMSDEEIVSLVKSNFETIVMPNVLALEYPDAQPGTKVDQYYVITFTAYTGATTVHTIRYLVSAPGTFTFTDCTWNNAE